MRPTRCVGKGAMNSPNRDRRKQQEEKRVGVRSQREIKKAVDDNADAPGKCPDSRRPAKSFNGRDHNQTFSNEEINERNDGTERDNAAFGQHLKVFVMSL